MITLSDFIIMFLSGGAAAVVALIWLGRSKQPSRQGLPEDADAITLTLFDGTVQYANRAALDVFRTENASEITWKSIKMQMISRFAGFPADYNQMLANLAETDENRLIYEAEAEHDQAVLQVTACGDSLELKLVDDVQPTVVDRHRAFKRLTGLKRSFSALNKITEPLWTTTPDGRVIWGNEAYRTLKARFVRENGAEGQDALFAPHQLVLDAPPERLSLTLDGAEAETHWYNVNTVKIDENRHLNIAVNVDQLIDAETMQRKFVQTLAKTFAQLSTGLAIFDRNRRLVLFNPALVDLTDLPAHFLSAQPNLQSFFDNLRNNRVLPEPKDYASWRKQIADLVIESADGCYEETWSLPDGRTYRVVGRPHPDGAIAFLFEDISIETSLSQRFRGQIAMCNMALDSMENAVVAFGANREMLLCNAAFRNFMTLPSELEADPQSVRSLSKRWNDKFLSSSLLHLISAAEPAETGILKLRDGRELKYTTNSLDGHTRMLTLYTANLARPKRPSSGSLSAAG